MCELGRAIYRKFMVLFQSRAVRSSADAFSTNDLRVKGLNVRVL